MTIDGTVRNHLGQPVDGAAVSLTTQGMATVGTVTSAAGTFVFGGVAAGTALLRASKPGYQEVSVVVTILPEGNTPVMVALSPITAPVPAPTTGRLSVTVVDDTAMPVADATATVRGVSAPPAKPTDATGTALFEDLAPGNYEVQVDKAGFASGSQTATVQVGATTSVMVKLALKRAEIAGTVQDQQGQGIGGAVVELVGPAGESPGRAVSAPGTGAFSFGARAGGPYTVRASAEGFLEAMVSVTHTGEFPSQVKLMLQASTAALKGRVTDHFDGPIAGAKVELLVTPARTTTTANDGGFTFTNVPTGTRTIKVSRNGFNPLSLDVTVTAAGVEANAKLTPQSAPSMSTRSSRTVSVNGSTLVFDVDVSAVDPDGKTIVLDPSSLAVLPDDLKTNYTLDSISAPMASNAQPYSALLLLDQSGSIAGTDPNDSRLQAAKLFLAALGQGDNVLVAAFSSAGSLPQSPVTVFGTQFSSDGRSFFGTMDMLSTKVGGGTPLYTSTVQMIDVVARTAPNPNKAVIVFTDGQNTDGGTIEAVTAACVSTGVKVFMVGLGTENVDPWVLAEIAQACGGSVMIADDARQMVSYFRTLGGILSGAAPTQRARFTAQLPSGTWDEYAAIGRWLYVRSGGAAIFAPFYLSMP